MNKVALVLFAALTVAAAWWLAVSSAQRARVPEVAAPPTEPETAASVVTGAPEPDSEPPPRAAVEENAASPSALTVRGRCVDAETRAPVAECRVELWAGPPKLRDEVASWRNPPQVTTDATGTFAFTVDPPPGYRVVLQIRPKRHLPVWPEWEPRASGVVDLGDVLLGMGCRVRGRVIDEQGAAQSGVQVSLVEVLTRFTGRMPERWRSASTAADGTFELAAPPGTSKLEVSRRRVISPEQVAIAAQQSEAVFDVVVTPKEPLVSLGGVVVDDDGAPIPGCRVFARLGSSYVTKTASDGSFRVEAAARYEDRVVDLSFDCPGFEPLGSERGHTFGQNDLRFVLHRLFPVRLVVVEAGTGGPIERYGVRCAAPLESGRTSSRDFALRDVGEHCKGVVQLTDVPRDSALLLVEPSDPDFDATKLVRLTAEELARRELHVALARMTHVRVRIATMSGLPMAGTRVEVLRPWISPWSTGSVTIASRAMPPERLAREVVHEGAVLVASGTTDARGEVDLRVPEHETLALRALGAAHAPVVREPAVLTAGETITVIVPAGATLVGQIGPAEILAQLRGRRGPAAAPGLFLARSDAVPDRFPVERDQRHPLAEDGSFAWTGIPPGAWDAYLELSRDNAWHLGAVDLQDGTTSELRLSLASMTPGTVHGRVQVDGAPASGLRAQLIGSQMEGGGAEPRVLRFEVRLDEEGAFAAQVTPGRYRLKAFLAKGAPSVGLMAEESVVVLPGATLGASFTVASAAARVRLIDAAGSPVGGVTLYATQPESQWLEYAMPTDAEGRTEIRVLPIGRVELLVRHNSFVDARAFDWYVRAHPRDVVLQQHAAVSLGVLDTRAGEMREVELVVPAEGVRGR